MQFKKIFYKEVDSTNNEIERLARGNAPEGTVLISEVQKKGKGQGKNYWISNTGGLYLSILLRPDKKLPLLSLMTGVVVVETLKNFVPRGFYIKWPNDIIHNSQKIAGILVESRYRGNVADNVIVGCGININQTVFSEVTEYRATSLKLITGNDFNIEEILNLFLEIFLKSYNKYLDLGENIVLESFKPYLYLHNRIVKVKLYNDKVIEGKLTGISEDGGLMILKSDGVCETIISGRIQAQ